jgi:hypothetical protein
MQALTIDSQDVLERLAAHSGALRVQVLDYLLRLPEDDLLRHLRDQVALTRAADLALGGVLTRVR